MVLFFTFIILILVVFCCVFIPAKILSKRTNIVFHLENLDGSVYGLQQITYDNAFKTIADSMQGANNTLSIFGIESLNINNFYNSLNKKKEEL